MKRRRPGWPAVDGYIEIEFDGCCTQKQMEEIADLMRDAWLAVQNAWHDATKVAGGGAPIALKTNAQVTNAMNAWFGKGKALNAKQMKKIADVLWETYRGFGEGSTKSFASSFEVVCNKNCKGGRPAAFRKIKHFGTITFDRDIVVCVPAFWDSLPNREARIAALVHEMTHWGAGTKDCGYAVHQDVPTTNYVDIDKDSVNLDTDELMNNASTYEGYVLQNYLK